MESLNSRNPAALALCESLLQTDSQNGVHSIEVAGATVIDFAPDGIGTELAAIQLAKICLGDIGEVNLLDQQRAGRPLVKVEIPSPLVPCIGCQYAGWPVSHEKYFAMGSGPARLLRGKEAVLDKYELTATGKNAVLVLETNTLPNETIIQQIADECGLPTSGLTVCVAPTSSLPGSLQVVARSVETTLHKLNELGFNLSNVTYGTGHAPLPPTTDDDLVALGWTNDSVLYGAEVQLEVDCEDESIESLLEKVPSSASKEFGSPFLELFKKYEYDFYKIDPMLFSPANVTFKNRRTGNQFVCGEVREDILRESFQS